MYCESSNEIQIYEYLLDAKKSAMILKIIYPYRLTKSYRDDFFEILIHINIKKILKHELIYIRVTKN